MPFINSYLSITLTEEKKDELKNVLGKIITTIPGKTEDWLMLQIQDNACLYFKGTKSTCAYVEIKIKGTADAATKSALVEQISAYLEKAFSIPKQNIYVPIFEVDDWGWNGRLL